MKMFLRDEYLPAPMEDHRAPDPPADRVRDQRPGESAGGGDEGGRDDADPMPPGIGDEVPPVEKGQLRGERQTDRIDQHQHEKGDVEMVGEPGYEVLHGRRILQTSELRRVTACVLRSEFRWVCGPRNRPSGSTSPFPSDPPASLLFSSGGTSGACGRSPPSPALATGWACSRSEACSSSGLFPDSSSDLSPAFSRIGSTDGASWSRRTSCVRG